MQVIQAELKELDRCVTPAGQRRHVAGAANLRQDRLRQEKRLARQDRKTGGGQDGRARHVTVGAAGEKDRFARRVLLSGSPKYVEMQDAEKVLYYAKKKP
jgi:predicted nucleic acid-binding Zn ribbon protein